MNSDTLQSLWTDERILDLVRKLRNDLIKDFLDERILVPWLKDGSLPCESSAYP
jgi:hypothetical protein